ncbi:hypothetical protein RUM43_006097 [Polyplax serrata]|uniref:Partial AB-hydrolase lipase domain-containing protein n=1 Tax=Polyplax serrata TaxID=468196 RepID=A0AAN8P0W7_POLSC
MNVLFSFALFLCVLWGVTAKQEEMAATNIRNMNARQIIRFFGYPSETHTILTPDGYLLELHRISRGRNGQSNPNLPPVLIQHGLVESSGTFLIIGPDDALPCLLADLGFDVWLGNSRGNKYSRGHVTVDPDKFEFWNYTYHEAAINDLPAEIDFVLEKTNREKLIYVGHSMGTTMYFILLSMLPEYNEKIELGVMMAPVAYMYHCKSLFIQAVAPFAHLVNLVIAARIGEFLPNNKFLGSVRELVCGSSVLNRDLCGTLLNLVVGDDPRAYSPEFMKILVNHGPEGYSFLTILHYGQFVTTGEYELLYTKKTMLGRDSQKRRFVFRLAFLDRFGMLDYGTLGNLRQYGVPYPPDYDLDQITVPTLLYAGQSDNLADLTDVMRLTEKVPSVKRLFVVEESKFGHMDFLISDNVKELLNDYVIADIMEHLGQNATGEAYVNNNEL